MTKRHPHPGNHRGRSGGVVDAPGKRHREPPPSVRGARHSVEHVAKARTADLVNPGLLRDKAWGQPRKKPQTGESPALAFALTSPAFDNGADIPVRHTDDGENVSPELHWEGAPAGTKAFAIVMDDPDAPSGTFTHWLLTDIPAHETTLAEDAEGIGVAGRNDMGAFDYRGPAPPRGHGVHRYFIRLYALRDLVRPTMLMTRASFDDELPKLTLGVAVLVGRYARH